MTAHMLGWSGIFRLGMVQTALGAIIVLATSTLNRVMVVELALPAMVPGALVAMYHAIQLSRPRFGHSGDSGGRRTPWIIGGMTMLALGGFGGALGTALVPDSQLLGFAVLFVAFVLIGAGVGAAGTSLLVLLAKTVDPARRAAAASIVWIMMIAGFAVTAGVAGALLDPFSLTRLVEISGGVSLIAMLVTLAAIRGIEPTNPPVTTVANAPSAVRFADAFKQIYAERHARLFTLFVFVSMLAYSAQDLILEPYAGALFAMTPGESTQLAGLQNVGVLLGMLALAAFGTLSGRGDMTQLKAWIVAGCLLSGMALAGLVLGAQQPNHWPLRGNVFFLGFANGLYAVSAIAAMMALAGRGEANKEGIRMGLWGAAQAIAMGLGGFIGTVGVDLTRVLLGSAEASYAVVFAVEAITFVIAAALGWYVLDGETDNNRAMPRFADIAAQEVFDGR